MQSNKGYTRTSPPNSGLPGNMTALRRLENVQKHETPSKMKGRSGTAPTTSQESRFRRLCSLTSMGTQSRQLSGIDCSAAPCPATPRRGPRSSRRMYAWRQSAVGPGLGCRRRHQRKRRCRCSRIWPPVPGAGRRERRLEVRLLES